MKKHYLNQLLNIMVEMGGKINLFFLYLKNEIKIKKKHIHL